MLNNNHNIKTLSNTIFVLLLITLVFNTNVFAMFKPNKINSKDVTEEVQPQQESLVPGPVPPFGK